MGKRRPLTREEIERTPDLTLARMKLSEDEKRMWREIVSEEQQERQASVSRLLAESEPILKELQAVGLEVSNLGAVDLTRCPCKAAITVLLKHLMLPYSDAIRASIARSLAVPEPEVQEAWPLLVQEYCNAPIGYGFRAKGDKKKYRLDAKDGLACVLSAAVTLKTLDELIALAKDKSNGDSRVLLLEPLRRSKDTRAKMAIDELADDSELAVEISSWKRRSR